MKLYGAAVGCQGICGKRWQGMETFVIFHANGLTMMLRSYQGTYFGAHVILLGYRTWPPQEA